MIIIHQYSCLNILKKLTITSVNSGLIRNMMVIFFVIVSDFQQWNCEPWSAQVNYDGLTVDCRTVVPHSSPAPPRPLSPNRAGAGAVPRRPHTGALPHCCAPFLIHTATPSLPSSRGGRLAPWIVGSTWTASGSGKKRLHFFFKWNIWDCVVCIVLAGLILTFAGRMLKQDGEDGRCLQSV